MSDNDTWSVTVTRNGEELLTIHSRGGLAGKPCLDDHDKDTIVAAGVALIRFRDEPPEPSNECGEWREGMVCELTKGHDGPHDYRIPF